VNKTCSGAAIQMIKPAADAVTGITGTFASSRT
jgi:hypothetical protein